MDVLYTANTVDTVYNNDTVYTVQTASHCLNRSMFVFIYCIFLYCILLGKVRTLLGWAEELLGKKWNGWVMEAIQAFFKKGLVVLTADHRVYLLFSRCAGPGW